MAGLLDAFNDPQFQRGLMMFAASTPMSEQSRAGLLSYVDNQEEAKMRRGLLGLQTEQAQAQIEGARAKAEAARKQLEFDNALFGGLLGQPQGAGFAPGSVAPDGSRPNPAAGGGMIASMTPDQLAAYKMRGHDFTNIWEQTRPDMQVSNGYAYDKRNLGAGFMPSLQTTADGKSTMTQIGPDGLPVVSAPRGAVDTYGAYKGVDADIARGATEHQARTNADWTPREVIDPQTGRRVLTSTTNALGRGGAPGTGYTGDPYVDAVMHTESRGRANAVSPAGAQGTMQTMPGTLRDPGFGITPARDNSPAELQRVGVEYLGKMNERYGDSAIAAVAYNWGPGNTDKWLAEGGDFRKLPKETQDYIGQVMLRAGINRTQGASQPQNVVGFSPQEEAAQKANATFQSGLATNAADVVSGSQAGYQSAMGTLQNVEQMRGAIKSAMVGPGTSPLVMFDRIGQSLGVAGKDSAERLAATRMVMQGLARQELAASGAMKGQGTLTESERAILRRAEAGEIDNMSKPELEALLNSIERTANYRIQGHTQLMERVRGGASPVDVMSSGAPTAARSAPAASPASPPPRPMAGMVVDGYRFKGGDPSNQANWERQ